MKNEGAREKPYILIAEDDPDDQLLINDAIEETLPKEVKARFVWDGQELTSLLKDEAAGRIQQPDLVILDLNMPRKDGRTAVIEIQEIKSLQGIPIVVLTTSNHPEDIQFCADHDVGYFRKPATFSELKEIIRRMWTDYL